jgi:isopenicillin N synthase-like dioxygenase
MSRALARRALGRRFSSAAVLPEIDLAALDARAPTAACREELVRLRSACESAGYFSLRTETLVAPQLVQAMYAQAQAFHSLPEEVKQQCHHGLDRRNARGYVPLGEEPGYEDGAVVSHVSAFDLANDLPASDPRVLSGASGLGSNVWPSEAHLPGFRDTARAYYSATTAVARLLFTAFAQCLELPAHTFLRHHSAYSRGSCRLLKYPGTGSVAIAEARNLGISAHTDFEAHTIMHGNAPGLQLATGAGSEEWMDAPVPDLHHHTVILGDMLERFTNGHWQATRHRVLHVSHERLSLIRFVGFDGDSKVSPLPQFGVPKTCYPPTTQSEHLDGAMRMAEARRMQLLAAGLVAGTAQQSKTT